MKASGVVAAGHPATAEAAVAVLEAGGNAFDAVIAGQWAACVAEPVLSSLGGGGFLLARQGLGRVQALDFFVQTPRHKRPPTEIDFLPIVADFGDAQQEFHIGLGSAATPGMVRGLFAAHRRWGSLPMALLLESAIALARDGVRVNAMQAYAFRIIGAIYGHSEAARQVFASSIRPGFPVVEGDLLRQPALVHTLECLAQQGADWFYTGELAHLVDEFCRREGGLLRLDDLQHYRAERRTPLSVDYRGHRIWTNPPPSSGGLLLGFALKLLASSGGVDASPRTSGLSGLGPSTSWPSSSRPESSRPESSRPESPGQGTAAALEALALAMAVTDQARLEAQSGDDGSIDANRLLDPVWLARYQNEIQGRAVAPRGTTHLSVMDGQGNVASLTASNGEGCGVLIPDTGVMLNNMLGEEDLNPHGFFRWQENQRLTSMMAPTLLVRADGAEIALGSGGSNRIRTAILQVLLNLLDHGLPLVAAVEAPRIHLEQGLLSVEAGVNGQDALAALLERYPQHRIWGDRNLFFGGVHAVARDGDGFSGAGDPRRGGVVRYVGDAGTG